MRSKVFVVCVWATTVCVPLVPACQVDTGSEPGAGTSSGPFGTGEPNPPGTADGSLAVDAASNADASNADASNTDASNTDAGNTDASGADAAPPEAGTADAALGCLGVPVLDPTAFRDPFGQVNLPAGTFGCTRPALAKIIRFTRQVRFTTFDLHTLTATTDYQMQLRAGCDLGSALITSGGRQFFDSRVLDPGLYTFVECNRGNFFAEPTPTPVNANTSCATAVALPTTIFQGPSPVPPPQPSTGVRMYDPAETRYYTFVARGSDQDRIVVEGLGITNGRAPFVIRTACSDPATAVYDNLANSSLWTNGPAYYRPPTLTRNATYWLVLSNVTPGLMITIRHLIP